MGGGVESAVGPRCRISGSPSIKPGPELATVAFNDWMVGWFVPSLVLVTQWFLGRTG